MDTDYTEATTYEHGYFRVRFTCLCRREHCADFTRQEHFDCPCGLRYFPTVRLLTKHTSSRRDTAA